MSMSSSRENVVIRTSRRNSLNSSTTTTTTSELIQPQQSITNPITSPEIRSIIPESIQQERELNNIQQERILLQNRFNNRSSIYPVIATIIVSMILYGFYTSSFQPTPVNSLNPGLPVGHRMVDYLNTHIKHWYDLWKGRFEDLKEPIGGSVVYERENKQKELDSAKERVMYGPSSKPKIQYPECKIEGNILEEHARDWDHVTIPDSEFMKPNLEKNPFYHHHIDEAINFSKEKETFQNQQKLSIDNIQKEVKEILDQAEKYRLSLFEQWKDKKEFTFQDLQQIKYQIRDGYRETRESLYSKARKGENIIESIYRP